MRTIAAIALLAVTGAAPGETTRFVLDGRSIAKRFPAGPSVAVRYPATWRLTARRLDGVLDPRTLFAVSSYRLRPGTSDDCVGTDGRGRPGDGVFVLVTEVLDGASLATDLRRLPARPQRFRLPTSGRAGCLPPASVVYRFRVAKRVFVVWVSIGPKASGRARAAARAVLDGLWIARYPLR